MRLRLIAAAKKPRDLFGVRRPEPDTSMCYPEKDAQGYQLVYWEDALTEDRLHNNAMCGKCAAPAQREYADGDTSFVTHVQENFYTPVCRGYCGQPLEMYRKPLDGDTTLELA
jgi:hypothetical protein